MLSTLSGALSGARASLAACSHVAARNPLLQSSLWAAPAALLQVRHHKAAKSRSGVWWQPRIQALAPDMCPDEPGKGSRRKKMQQKKMQIVTDHARRKEGERRKGIFNQLKKQAHHDRVKQVYRDYAEELRRRAPPPAASAAAADAEPPQ